MAALDGRVYVSCGTNGRAAFGDLWVLSATGASSARWEQLPSPPGEARWGCSLSCVGRRLYLFGGDTSLGMVGSLLMFDIGARRSLRRRLRARRQCC
ncbi:MAG: hypothetical protein J0H57_17940 [Rhodospirillales bacterium]|nr:hypothetical protein [Rhodospirillales bacterium]